MNSDKVRKCWAERSGEFSPTYYAHHGPNAASESIRARIDAIADPDPTILELGCSSGRHLAHLHDRGYRNLHGVEINGDAFDVMADEHPHLAEDGSFHNAAIENVVTDFAADQFDAVFSVETLQHLHPDSEWVFDELSRITDDLLVTVENEREAPESNGTAVNYVNDEFPLYFRNWNQVFTERGFVEVGSESVKRDTLRAFRPA